jgi:hypothetical protein
MTSKGLGKILTLGAGLVVSGIFAEKAYSLNETRHYTHAEIDVLIETGKITLDNVISESGGTFMIRKSTAIEKSDEKVNKAKKETAEAEKKTEEKVEEKKVAEEKKEAKKEKRTEIERQDKRVFGLDIKGYLFSDTDGNKSNTTGFGIGCDAEAVAFKKLLGIGIGTYAKGKIDYNKALSSYGSDSASDLDSLTSKVNIPFLVKIKRFYLGLGAQLENIIASIDAKRSDNTIVHTENYSGSTANLGFEGNRVGLNAYFGSISGTIDDKVNNLSVKRNVNGSTYGLELVYRLNNKKRIIAEIEGGKKGDYDSSELKLSYAGKDNMEYGIKASNVNGNNYNNSQIAVYLSGRLGRKQ